MCLDMLLPQAIYYIQNFNLISLFQDMNILILFEFSLSLQQLYLFLLHFQSYSHLFRLLTVTALIWFIINVIIQNPLQVAVTILILYFLRLARNLVPFSSSSSGNNGSSFSSRINQENIPDRREYNTLAHRVNSMEEKTDLLNSKLDRLTRLLDRQIEEQCVFPSVAVYILAIYCFSLHALTSA